MMVPKSAGVWYLNSFAVQSQMLYFGLFCSLEVSWGFKFNRALISFEPKLVNSLLNIFIKGRVLKDSLGFFRSSEMLSVLI